MKNIISLYKNAFGGLKKEIWLLSVVMFINRSGTMVVAFLSLYLTQKAQLSVEKAGLVMTIYGAGALFGSWLGGRVADLKGHFFVQFWSLFIGGILFFFIGISYNFYFICLVSFILSTFSEAYRPANQVAISHYSTPETFTRSVSLVRLAINLGWSIGPAIGGFLAFYNYNYLFWIDGITNILAAILVYFFLNADFEVVKEKILKVTKTLDSPLKDRFFLWFLFFSTLYALCFSPMFTVMNLYFKEILHFNTKQIGIIMAFNGAIVAFVEMILLFKIQGKYNILHLIAFGVFLLILNFLIIIGFSSFNMILFAMLIASFSEIFAMPFMNTITINRAKSHNRGQYSAFYAMTWAFSQTLSPFISTQIIGNYGYQALLFTFVGISCVSFCGFMVLKRNFHF